MRRGGGLYFLKRQIHNAPRCPRCHYGLLLTFRGKGRVNCPECGTQVINIDSTYHVSRWRFLAFGFLGLVGIPLMTNALCWIIWSAHLATDRSSDTERWMILALFSTQVYQLTAPVVVSRWHITHRQYLSGAYVWPSGWLIFGSLSAGWLLTTVLLVLSIILWKHDVPV